MKDDIKNLISGVRTLHNDQAIRILCDELEESARSNEHLEAMLNAVIEAAGEDWQDVDDLPNVIKRMRQELELKSASGYPVITSQNMIVPDGYVMLPKVPTQAHLESIAMRYRHDFFLLEGTPRDSALATARQMYEECSGQGFYSLPASHQAPVKQPSSKPKSELLQRAEKLAEDTAALAQRVQCEDLRAKVRSEHAEWATATFGNTGPIGPLKHLSAEALEAAAAPDDLSEWADMQFLFWDAQRKAGISDEQITQAMVAKLQVNKARQWPEPKEGEPRFHIKDGE